MPRQPAVFVSHGAPTLALEECPARSFLQTLGRELDRPDAILVLSAHWETRSPAVSIAAKPETIYDFRGFPEELYRLRYPAPGAPEHAVRAADALQAAGFDQPQETQRGLDHGAWVPLSLMFPLADIPVAQISLQSHLGPDYHYRLGQALAPLRDQNVLILGTGSMTHNLGEFRGQPLDSSPPSWVTEFAGWMRQRLDEGDMNALLEYRSRGPSAARNHPTEEHLLPLYAVLGALMPGETPTIAHQSYTYGILAMDAVRIG